MDQKHMDRRAEVVAAYKGGLSLRQCAERFHVTMIRIHQIIKSDAPGLMRASNDPRTWVNGTPFQPEEDALIRQGFENGSTDTEMVMVLAAHGFIRTGVSVYGRRRSLGFQRSKANPPPPVGDTPDQKFKRAMLAAIHAGEESAVLGVVKDRRPWVLKTIHAEPTSSCMGSAASACADA